MKTKINLATVFLITIITFLGGLSIFIALRLKEEKPATVPTKTKAADITYRKLITLNTTPPELPTPTSESSSLTTDVTIPVDEQLSITQQAGVESEETPTPTQINLVTTPLLTSEPTETELAYHDSSQSEELEITVSPTKETVRTLPQSGIYQTSILIFFAALTLIFVSFVL